MLALLLDEQISPTIAEQLRLRQPRCAVWSMYGSQAAALAGRPDRQVLQTATEASLTLVTYDLKTIPPLLAEWGAAGIAHAGVIFVDQLTIRSSDFGRLVRALEQLWEREHERDWKARIVFLDLG